MGKAGTELKKKIYDYLISLEEAGLPVIFAPTARYSGRVKSGNYLVTGRDGWGDLTGGVQGVLTCFEVKADGDIASQDQLDMQERFKYAGGEYYFVTSVDEVKFILETMMNITL